MPREKFQYFTDQMYYTLLCLTERGCGADITERLKNLTGGRIVIGPGTLYHLLELFLKEGFIIKIGTDGRRIYYILTSLGRKRLEEEYQKLRLMARDYEICLFGKEVSHNEI